MWTRKTDRSRPAVSVAPPPFRNEPLTDFTRPSTRGHAGGARFVRDEFG